MHTSMKNREESFQVVPYLLGLKTGNLRSARPSRGSVVPFRLCKAVTIDSFIQVDNMAGCMIHVCCGPQGSGSLKSKGKRHP